MSDRGGVIFNLHRAPHPVSDFTSFNVSRPSPSRGGWKTNTPLNYSIFKQPSVRALAARFARVMPGSRPRTEGAGNAGCFAHPQPRV